MKRFYKFATIEAIDNKKILKLDQKTMRTPKGAEFVVPDQLQNIILNEWANASETIDPIKMIGTQIAITAQDLHPEKHNEWKSEILSYLDTDYLAYHADTPPEFAKRQATQFSKIINQIENYTGFKINTTTELLEIQQPDELKNKIEDFWNNLSPLNQTSFYLTTIETGSALIAFAFFNDLIEPKDIFDAIFIDEIYKGEIYNDELYGTAPDIEKKQNSVEKFLSVVQTMIQYP